MQLEDYSSRLQRLYTALLLQLCFIRMAIILTSSENIYSKQKKRISMFMPPQK